MTTLVYPYKYQCIPTILYNECDDEYDILNNTNMDMDSFVELDSIEEIYENTLKIISPGNEKSGYKCARYKPLTYVKPEFFNDVLEAGGYNEEGTSNKLPKQQENIHDFIKRMMVRRFESSTHSFSITLDRTMYGSDQAASLELSGMKNLSESINKTMLALGKPSLGIILDDEKPISKKLRAHIKKIK